MKLNILLTAATALFTTSLTSIHAGELLKNGDFSTQMEGWWLEQRSPALGTTTFETKGPDDQPAVEIEVVEPGEQGWQMQLVQKGFAVKNGKTYTVKFLAKAEPELYGFFVALAQASKEYKTLVNKAEILLSPSWKEYEFDLLASEDESDARLIFGNLGQKPGKIWFASVSLVEQE